MSDILIYTAINAMAMGDEETQSAMLKDVKGEVLGMRGLLAESPSGLREPLY